jgi:hypothetical protein
LDLHPEFGHATCDRAFLNLPAHNCRMAKPTRHFEREVRRVRQLTARIVLAGCPDQTCHVMDLSLNGAKVLMERPSDVPSRFELAFNHGDRNRRICQVIWRRGKTMGIQFI